MNIFREPRLLSFGSAGLVYQVTDDIAVKRAFADDNEGIHNEYRIYDVLDSMPYCPNLVRSFYRVPSANFLQYLSGGTVDQRFRQHQIRDPSSDRVVEVTKSEPKSLIWRWMAELANAIAWLESLGYVHGDIRPPNLLLDGNDHLKVVDFDNTIKTGFDFDGCQPPYARVLGEEDANKRGTFGCHGPRTEQFAIGSVFYYMTRGFEPYDNEWFGRKHGNVVVSLLQEKKFPELNGKEMDTIIHNCWHGKYESIKRLEIEVIRLGHNLRLSMATTMSEEEYGARRQECRKLVGLKVLEDTPRTFA